MLVPEKEPSTKQTWVTFYNEEAADAIEEFEPEREGDGRVFQTSNQPVNRELRHVSEDPGIKITVQNLRRWSATEMSRLGVDAKHIDAFAERAPSSGWRSII